MYCIEIQSRGRYRVFTFEIKNFVQETRNDTKPISVYLDNVAEYLHRNRAICMCIYIYLFISIGWQRSVVYVYIDATSITLSRFAQHVPTIFHIHGNLLVHF